MKQGKHRTSNIEHRTPKAAVAAGGGRVLDHLGVAQMLMPRWQEEKESV